MRTMRLTIYFLSVCFTLLFHSKLGYGQDSSLIGVWKLNYKKQITGPVYLNALPNLIIVKQLNGKLLIESKTNDLDGKEQINVDTISLDGSSSKSITASNRKKETRIEDYNVGKSFTKTSSFGLPGLPDKIDFTRKEGWTLKSEKNDLVIIKEHASSIDSIDKWKVQGNYEKTSWEELALNKMTGKGIRFEQGRTWDNILKKAKAENKMIFVDCYATWCGPCKVMEATVYPVDRVGEFMERHFVSLKLQMDTGKTDDGSVKLLYPLARRFAKDYNVFALPTLLFFSPDGRILHKEIGGKSINEFLTTVNETLDSSKQLYTLIDRLRQRRIDSKQLPTLSKKLKELKENIPNSYIQSYFEGLSEADLLKKESLQFATDFLQAISSTDKLFMLSYKKPDDINKIMGRNVAKVIVYNVIHREEIVPQINNAKTAHSTPDWRALKDTICKKFNCHYAEVLVSQAEIGWYRQEKHWKNYTRSLVKYMEIEGLKNEVWWYTLNMKAMEIVKYSNDTIEIESALKWIDKAIQLVENNEMDKKLLPGVMDTKAALLYNMGNVKEAISIYEIITKLDPNRSVTLNQLKNGKNPWAGIK